MISGISVLCCAKTDDITRKQKYSSCIVVVAIGVLQLIMVSCFLIGWIWSGIWGVSLIGNSGNTKWGQKIELTFSDLWFINISWIDIIQIVIYINEPFQPIITRSRINQTGELTVGGVCGPDQTLFTQCGLGLTRDTTAHRRRMKCIGHHPQGIPCQDKQRIQRKRKFRQSPSPTEI